MGLFYEKGLVRIIVDYPSVDPEDLDWLPRNQLALVTANRIYADPSGIAAMRPSRFDGKNSPYIRRIKSFKLNPVYIDNEDLVNEICRLEANSSMVCKMLEMLRSQTSKAPVCLDENENAIKIEDLIKKSEHHFTKLQVIINDKHQKRVAGVLVPILEEYLKSYPDFVWLANLCEFNAGAFQKLLVTHNHLIYSPTGKIIRYNTQNPVICSPLRELWNGIQ